MAKNPNRLAFELDPNLDDSLITSYAGLPLVVEMFRAAGGAAETDRVLRHKKKALGFSVVTNRKGNGLEIIQWHRLKAGTIEHVHHVVVNELAGGVAPGKWFGAKAAWFRANTLLYDRSRLRIHLKPAT